MIKLLYVYKGYLTILLLGFTLLSSTFIACETKDSPENIIEDKNNNVVFFTVSGIADITDIEDGKQAGLYPYNNVEQQKVIVGGDGYEIEFTKASDDLTIGSKLNFSKDRVAAAMTAGTGYRILFYEIKSGDEIYFKSDGITAGTTAFSTKLPAQKTYKWYAYSYNQSTVPSLPVDVNNPVIQSRTDAPLLLAAGQISTGTLGSPSQHIAITFTHKVAKVRAVIDARGLIATGITSLQANFSNFNLTTHNFNIKSGAAIGSAASSTAVPTNSLSFENIGPTEASTAVKRSTDEYYTSTASVSVSVTVSQLTITRYGSGSSTIVSSGSPKSGTLNFSTGLPAIKNAKLNFVQGGTIGGTVWATGNLYYDGTAPDPFKYRFDSERTQGQTASCNYYWQWNSLFPRSVTGGKDYAYQNPSYVGDPCSKVYPAGTWKTPSESDFKSLNSSVAQPNSPRNGAIYFTSSSGVRVYFHEAGWLEEFEPVTDSDNCKVNNTNDGHYWSSTSVDSKEARELEVDERGGSNLGNTMMTDDKRMGFSVRCIRK